MRAQVVRGTKCGVYNGAFIDLEGELGIWLGIDFLGRSYTTEMIRYFDIEADYRPLSQVMAKDYAKMATTFLLYLLGAYLLANGG